MSLSFTLATPRRIVFGRGVADTAAGEIVKLGQRVVLVRGTSVGWADTLEAQLNDTGCAVMTAVATGEPDLTQLTAALKTAREMRAEVVVSLGGGSVIDLGKAVAALTPGSGDPLDHLEVVGRGAPLTVTPLPFVAIPTTAGTGAEATKNAVIAVPQHGRKVSLRDDRMLANLALVDPALTDRCPRHVTLASGLDAVTQVIEPYLSCKANVLTDVLCRDAIPRGLSALTRLMQAETTDARDDMSLTSLYGGIALANAGLGAVHGFAGVIGGRTGASHGAICGRLLVPVLRANDAAGAVPERMAQVKDWITQALDVKSEKAFDSLEDWINAAGLPRLSQMSATPMDCTAIVAESRTASSMRGNPVVLTDQALSDVLNAAL